MIKAIKRSWVSLIAFLLLVIMASPVMAYTYYAFVNLIESAGTSYAMYPALVPNNTTWQITQGYISATGLNTRVRTDGSTIPHMLADDKLLFAYPLPANTTQPLRYTTGEAAATAFNIITGRGGYFYTTDDATLELGNDFEIEVDGYIDTAAGASKNLVYKQEAFKTYVSAASEVTSAIYTSAIFRPNAAGTVTGLTPLGSANNFENVDEAVANDADYNYRAAAGNAYDLYAIANHAPIDVGVIEKVTVSVRGQRSGVTAVYRSRIRTEATNYDSADFTDLAWATHTIDYTTNPNTGTAWTWTQIDALEIGCYASSDGAGSNGYISQLFITVYYWLPVTATAVSSGEKTVTVYAADGYPEWATGNVLTYDGSDYATRTVADYRIADSAGTLVGWIKTSSATNQVLFSSTDIGSTSSYIRLYVADTGKLMIDQRNAADVRTFINGDTNVADGAWHMVSVVSDGAVYVLYVDGVLQALTVNGGVNNGDWFADTTLRDNITIGANINSGGVGLQTTGTIGDVLLYSSAKSQAEIQAIFAGYRDTVNLVGLWYSDEGTGATVYDYGGGSADLTITGATWATSTYTSGNTGRPCDYYIQVDTNRWGKNLKGASVPDNANDYYFCQTNVAPYLNSLTIDVGGAEATRYEPISYIVATTLPDETGANDATIVWGTNETGLSVVMGAFTIADPATGTGEQIETVGAAGEVNAGGENWFPEDSELVGIPFLRPTVRDLTIIVDDPEWLWWLFMAFLTFIVSMAVVAKYTQHLWATGITGIIVLGACSAAMMIQPAIIVLMFGAFLIPGLMERKSSW